MSMAYLGEESNMETKDNVKGIRKDSSGQQSRLKEEINIGTGDEEQDAVILKEQDDWIIYNKTQERDIIPGASGKTNDNEKDEILLSNTKENDRLEGYLNNIFERQCRFAIEENELEFIQTGTEKYVLKFIDDFHENYENGECNLRECDIKHCTPELLKVGSFYEGTRNKYPDEFDYIVVIGTVDKLPITTPSDHKTCKCCKDRSYRYESDLDASTAIEFVTMSDHHGPAVKITLCYKKGNKEHLISVDISSAIRHVYTRDIHNIKNEIKEDDVFHSEFHNEILKTGSFLLLDSHIYISGGRTCIGPFGTCITETELYFMKYVVSAKHKQVYRLLKYLINGNFSDKLLKYISPGHSLSISSYNIKTALFHHHYQCQNKSEAVSDCVLDILNYFLNKMRFNQTPKGASTAPDLKYEVFPDRLYTFDLQRKEPSQDDTDSCICIYTTDVFRLQTFITGTENFINTIIFVFSAFIERLNCLRKSAFFKKCTHSFNDSLLETSLQTPLILESVEKKMSKEMGRNESDWRRLAEIKIRGKIDNCSWCNYSSGEPFIISSGSPLTTIIYSRTPLNTVINSRTEPPP